MTIRTDDLKSIALWIGFALLTVLAALVAHWWSEAIRPDRMTTYPLTSEEYHRP